MFARPFPCTQLPTTTWAQLLSAVYIPRFSPPLHNRAVPRAVPSRRRSGGTRYSPTLEAEPCHQLGNAVRDVSVTCSGVVMQRHKSGSPSPLALLGPSPPEPDSRVFLRGQHSTVWFWLGSGKNTYCQRPCAGLARMHQWKRGVIAAKSPLLLPG